MERKLKRLGIIHLGVGNVGKTVLAQITAQKAQIAKKLGIELVYCGLFTVRNGMFASHGLSLEKLHSDLTPAKYAPVDIEKMMKHAIDEIETPFVVIDTTASDQTVPLLSQALEKGGYVVMSNKKPLAGKLAEFENLHKIGNTRLFYETVVGAGLPVISTVKQLVATGDEILQIQGCFSGTLGYLFSQLDMGKKFSDVVLEAKRLGFTEPDPRDDLGGVDVARKALILARLLGQKKELSDIALEGLYPKGMDGLSVEEFLRQLPTLDAMYAEKITKAKKAGKVLRFVATVTKSDCRVGLEEVDAASDIGSLRGPDNIIMFQTTRYKENPLVIKGPGAGLEVTAGGVFGDVLTIATVVSGGNT